MGRPWNTVALRVGRGVASAGTRVPHQILSLAIDRRRLAKLVGHRSQAASTLVPPGSDTRTVQASHDRQRARQLLAKLREQAGGWGSRQLSLLVDASRLDDRVLAGQLVADLDRVGLSAKVETLAATRFRERVDTGRADLALVRFVAPVPLARYALARAHARAGQHKRAAECLAGTRSCDSWRDLAGRLDLVPLVHVGIRLHYDARLGGLQLTPGGAIPWADVYWRRDR